MNVCFRIIALFGAVILGGHGPAAVAQDYEAIESKFPLRVTLAVLIDDIEQKIQWDVECRSVLYVSKDLKQHEIRSAFDSRILGRVLPDGSAIILVLSQARCPTLPPYVLKDGWDNPQNYKFLPAVIWMDDIVSPTLWETAPSLYETTRQTKKIPAIALRESVIPLWIHYEKITKADVEPANKTSERIGSMYSAYLKARRAVGSRAVLRGILGAVYTEDAWRSVTPFAAILNDLDEVTVLDPGALPGLENLNPRTKLYPNGLWHRVDDHSWANELRFGRSTVFYTFDSDESCWDAQGLTRGVYQVYFGEERDPGNPLLPAEPVSYDIYPKLSFDLYPELSFCFGTRRIDLRDWLHYTEQVWQGLWIYDPETRLVHRFMTSKQTNLNLR